MLNKSGESGHHFLVPDLRGKEFSLFPLRMMLALVFSYLSFIRLRNFPSIPRLLRAFVMIGCWILSNAFSVSQ